MNAPNPPEVENQPPLKRTRQACDPCRRKKSKCSGERPVCTTCDRLRTRCSYGAYRMEAQFLPYSNPNPPQGSRPQPPSADTALDEWPSRGAPGTAQLQSRIESLESTLAEVVEGLRSRRDPDLQSASFASLFPAGGDSGRRRSSVMTPSATNLTSSAVATALESAPNDQPTLPPQELVIEMASIYLKYCDCQPLPLFQRDGFVSTLTTRDRGIVYGVIALASRFSDTARSTPGGTVMHAKKHADAARQLVMSQITSSRVEISTLQTLCLLALFNLHNGEMALMRVHISLAMTLAHCARLDHEPAAVHGDGQVLEERRRCYWSIVLLQRLVADGVVATTSSHTRLSKPGFPSSAVTPPTLIDTDQGQTSVDEQSGIFHVVVRLSEVWLQAQQYVLRCRGLSDPTAPPWASQSAYHKTLQCVMSLGSQLSSAHRYRSIRPSGISTQELDEARDYWGPWLLSRLLYHTTICIINHPILVMLQLQGWQNVPELFLQQTNFQRNHHTSWLLYFIDFAVSKQFYISDPLFAYCAAVLATIELHQSFIEDDEIPQRQKQRRRLNYDKCFNFIVTLSSKWPFLELVAIRLQQIKKDMIASYESNLSGSDSNICIDISSFFSLLDIDRFFSTDRQAGSDGSLFGTTLSFRVSPEPSQRADLQRLPPITVMESSPATPTRNADNVTSWRGNSPSTDNYMNLVIPDEELLFPAAQIFGNAFYPSMNPWDSLTGLFGTDVMDPDSSGPQT